MNRAVEAGEKVYLRPLELEDIDGGWLDWINDKELNKNLLGSYPVTRTDLEEYYKQSQPPAAVMFAVCEKETDNYIGNTRLSRIDWVHRKCLYGLLLGAAGSRGKGYGTETLTLLFRYAFHTLGMNRVVTSVWAENKASLAIMEKAGVVREGVAREDVFKEGKYHDTVMLAMLRSDFNKKHGGE